jgi:drug/metabolite transporter (DMT)-like permease
MVVAIGVCWGMNWPAVKILLGFIPPFTLRALAFVAGAVVVLTMARLSGASLYVPKRDRLAVVGGGLFIIFLFNLCTAFGQLSMATSRAAVIAFTMPVWTTLLAIPLLKETPGWRQAFGLVCGMAGLLVLLGPKGWNQGVGPLYMLGAAVFWALGTIVMKKRVWTTPPLVIVGWQYVLAAIPMLILASVFDPMPHLERFSPLAWGALTWHIVLSICMGQILYYQLIRRATAVQATISTLLVPVIGVSGSLLLLGEELTPSLLLALVLILAALGSSLVRFPLSLRLRAHPVVQGVGEDHRQGVNGELNDGKPQPDRS